MQLYRVIVTDIDHSRDLGDETVAGFSDGLTREQAMERFAEWCAAYSDLSDELRVRVIADPASRPSVREAALALLGA